MSAPPFNQLVTLRAFGEMLDPPVCERTIRRMVNVPDGLPVVELPNGKHRINLQTAWDYLKGRERQLAPRRAGRASASKEAAGA